MQQQLTAGESRGQPGGCHRRAMGHQPEHQQQVEQGHRDGQPGRQTVIPRDHRGVAPDHRPHHPAQIHADIDPGEAARLVLLAGEIRRHRLHDGDVAVAQPLHHPAEQQQGEGAPGDAECHQGIAGQHARQREQQQWLAAVAVGEPPEPGAAHQLEQGIEPHDDPQPHLAAPVGGFRRQHPLRRIQQQGGQYRGGEAEAGDRQRDRHHQHPEGVFVLLFRHVASIK